jgi:hypothetical protein
MRSSLLRWMPVVILCAGAGCAQKEIEQVAAGEGVTGTWNIQVDATSGPGTPTFALTQEGEQVTGTYKGVWGLAPVTGSIKDNQIALNFTVKGANGDVDVTYTGLVTGDTMTGDVKMNPVGEGTFTGTRQR